MKTKAIRIHKNGGPEVMKWEEIALADPGAGEVLLSHQAIGLNYIDVYHRSGVYPTASLPMVLGMEGAGTIKAIGAGVKDFQPGDRVAYAGNPPGAYAEDRVILAHRLVMIPDNIAFDQAAAMMMRGLTAQYLIRRTYRVKPGDTILCHAAAGGVGLILCQWAKSLGAIVIGTVGSEEKAVLAREHGCDYTINYTKENFTAKTKEITNGKGVAVVYDSVGAATFEGSLDCLKPMGMMVSFGNASGTVPPISPGILGQKGSLFLTRPSILTYTADRTDLLNSAEELIRVVGDGTVQIKINQRYPLQEAGQAHSDLEARKTTGSTILIP